MNENGTTLIEVGNHTHLKMKEYGEYYNLTEALFLVTKDELTKRTACITECGNGVFLLQPNEEKYYFIKLQRCGQKECDIDVVSDLPELKWGYKIVTATEYPKGKTIFAEMDKQTYEIETTHYLISW